MSLIIIDPGHGGADPGAVANGLLEKDLNLGISLKLKELLTGSGIPVRLTRESDQDLSLEARCDTANNWPADLFLSVHCNGSPDPLAQGLEIFCHPGSAPGTRLARAIHQELLQLGRRDRGIKTAEFYVLKHTRRPAVLAECGFITNPGEADWLKSHLAEMAGALMRGIKKGLSAEPLN